MIFGISRLPYNLTSAELRTVSQKAIKVDNNVEIEGLYIDVGGSIEARVTGRVLK